MVIRAMSVNRRRIRGQLAQHSLIGIGKYAVWRALGCRIILMRRLATQSGVSDTHVDVDTGELVRLLRLNETEPIPGRRYVYEKGYVTMSLMNISRLINKRLPADAYRLALLISCKMSHGTALCHASNAEYAAELGINKNRVSTLIGQLGQLRFIARLNPRLVMVNPSWCFRGSPTEQRTCIATWQALHPIGAVSDRGRKTA